ncbi:hypothetical protein TNIN_129281 [Trichonephila inaurata madagascariensis]|uniref:Uncharacterized protein n=1 Tax=Trichonephila inaurata madagascariensis TaxID=2747483 RepID=A0A8X6Y2B8_9ARAC|nr:hypothetical protein TNIN_129281 [Trichonephila inaurata madagascariensis]
MDTLSIDANALRDAAAFFWGWQEVPPLLIKELSSSSLAIRSPPRGGVKQPMREEWMRRATFGTESPFRCECISLHDNSDTEAIGLDANPKKSAREIRYTL